MHCGCRALRRGCGRSPDPDFRCLLPHGLCLCLCLHGHSERAGRASALITVRKVSAISPSPRQPHHPSHSPTAQDALLRCDDPAFRDLVARTAIKALLRGRHTDLALNKNKYTPQQTSCIGDKPAMLQVPYRYRATATGQKTKANQNFNKQNKKSGEVINKKNKACWNQNVSKANESNTSESAFAVAAIKQTESPSKPLIKVNDLM